MTRGRYWFTPRGTPFFPGQHVLWSRNWVSDELDPIPALGEVPDYKQRWSPGRLGQAVPPALLVGPADCVSSGDLAAAKPVDRTLPNGIDSRCYTMAGLPAPPWNPPSASAGGLSLDGAAVVFRFVSPVGGIRLDGIAGAAVPTGFSGGIRLDGTGPAHQEPDYAGAGGIRLDGTGPAHQEPDYAGAGGIRLDGHATYS